jgi:hypothetical protein
MHTMQLWRKIDYLQKLLYTVKRIRMSPTPTLNIHSAKKVKDIVVCDQQMKKREHNQYKCLIPFIFSQINTEWNQKKSQIFEIK